MLRHTGPNPGIYAMGALYWRGVWGPPTEHIYILKILMTAEKCKKKKQKKNNNKQTIKKPKDNRTVSTESAAVPNSVCLSVSFGGGGVALPSESAPDMYRSCDFLRYQC